MLNSLVSVVSFSIGTVLKKDEIDLWALSKIFNLFACVLHLLPLEKQVSLKVVWGLGITEVSMEVLMGSDALPRCNYVCVDVRFEEA